MPIVGCHPLARRECLLFSYICIICCYWLWNCICVLGNKPLFNFFLLHFFSFSWINITTWDWWWFPLPQYMLNKKKYLQSVFSERIWLRIISFRFLSVFMFVIGYRTDHVRVKMIRDNKQKTQSAERKYSSILRDTPNVSVNTCIIFIF